MTDEHWYKACLHSIGFTDALFRIAGSDSSVHVYENLSGFLSNRRISLERSNKILQRKRSLDESFLRETIEKLRIQIVLKTDAQYPQLLRSSSRPPEILYVRGALPSHSRLISLVGSRSYQSYASEMIRVFVRDLVRAGFDIVSGGALGLDTIAHASTLESGGVTHCVLGSGINVLYPRSNSRIMQEIIDAGGSVMSQFPIGTESLAYNFPIRNQTVAALSKGTLIGQAGAKSGTLITARLALEENRDVFVIPAAANNQGFQGSLELIRDGLGKLVLDADDILCEYDLSGNQSFTKVPLLSGSLQEKIYTKISGGINSVEDISVAIDMSVHDCLSEISMMEISGAIRREGESIFCV